jgi:hypothetical protein
MKKNLKKPYIYAGAGLVFLLAILAMAFHLWRQPAIHHDLKFSYTVLVEAELLDEGDWEGLLEPVKKAFPSVEFIIRPRMESEQGTDLPPFDLLIGRQSLVDEATAHQSLQNAAVPFFETGYQMIYARKDQMPDIPDNWALLNLKAQAYLDSANERFLLAAADQAQTYLPLLLAQSTSAADIFELMRDLRLSYRALPLGCPLPCAIKLFEDGKSALFWGTDRYLAEIASQVADNLVLAPLPKLGLLPSKTPRQTVFIGTAARPSNSSLEVTQALQKSWQGQEGTLLIFDHLHRFASAELKNPGTTGNVLLDQMKVIVRDFTVSMDIATQSRQTQRLRPIVDDVLTAKISATDAAAETLQVLRPAHGH